jgi:hypothetical protein
LLWHVEQEVWYFRVNAGIAEARGVLAKIQSSVKKTTNVEPMKTFEAFRPMVNSSRFDWVRYEQPVIAVTTLGGEYIVELLPCIHCPMLHTFINAKPPSKSLATFGVCYSISSGTKYQRHEVALSAIQRESSVIGITPQCDVEHKNAAISPIEAWPPVSFEGK